MLPKILTYFTLTKETCKRDSCYYSYSIRVFEVVVQQERSACSIVRQGKSLVRIQLLNSEIIGKSLINCERIEICERIEGRLWRLASGAKAKYEIVKGAVAHQQLGYTKQLDRSSNLRAQCHGFLAMLIIFW